MQEKPLFFLGETQQSFKPQTTTDCESTIAFLIQETKPRNSKRRRIGPNRHGMGVMTSAVTHANDNIEHEIKRELLAETAEFRTPAN